MAKLYQLPTVLSTVNVATGRNKPMIHQVTDVLGDAPIYDRTTLNAWEDTEFLAAVKATGRKKLVISALWTEVCLAFPTLDALRDGYDVYPVVDACGSTSEAAHRAGLERMTQAGARPISWVSLICELQRDWGRVETRQGFSDILFAVEGN
jgi:nicotinamidase-related amidase